MAVTKVRKARQLAPAMGALALASALGIGTAGSAVAAPVEDLHLDLPAGLACTFELQIDGIGSKQNQRTFTDQGGNNAMVITAGKGYDLTFRNAATGESISFPSNGSVQRITFNEDGTQTVQATGHNVVILFPTDVPAGPSTTLYTGRLVYIADEAGNFTVQSTSGPTTDICALLA